jgi:hypothetical protein
MNCLCSNNYNVGFQLELDYDYTDFTTDPSAYSDFMQGIADILNGTIDQVSINSITNGSTIINGSIEAYDEETAKALAKLFHATVLANSDVLGYVILKSSTAAFHDNTPISDTYHNVKSPSKVIPIVLGICIPITIIAIAITVILCICRQRRSKAADISIRQREIAAQSTT